MKQADYSEVRHLMAPGDIIAFGGRGLVSSIIKWKTRSPVSHVGIVMLNDGRVKLIESTSLDGHDGVGVCYLSERIREYRGEVWWLPLGAHVRARLDEKTMFDWLLAQDGKPYDTFQAVMSACIFWNRESFKNLFCSELCAGGLEAGGVWHGNASELTPADLVEEDLYSEVVQILGREKSLFSIKKRVSKHPFKNYH